MDWPIRGSNPAMENPPSPVQNVPEAHSATYTMNTWSFRGLSDRGVALNTHPLLVSKLKKE
jgi:hypothetical protein